MEPKIVSKPAFTVAGIKYHGKNEQGEIPRLWEAFGPRMQEFRNVVNPEVCFGVCDNMDEETGAFDYVAAVEVADDTDLPEGMVAWAIPAQTYAVFTCTLPTIGQAYEHIYQTWLPASEYKRACGPELELYDADFDPRQPESKMYLYIPVE